MIAVHIEVSAKNGGYPISIGIASSDGVLFYAEIAPHEKWSRLIWDPHSERLHGLTPSLLAERGEPVRDVAARANMLFQQKTLVSSSRPSAILSLDQMCDAAGITPAFDVADFEVRTMLRVALLKGGGSLLSAAAIDYQVMQMPRGSSLYGAAAWVAAIEAAHTASTSPKNAAEHIDSVFASWRDKVAKFLEGHAALTAHQKGKIPLGEALERIGVSSISKLSHH
jgi:hypothetical protein